MPIPTLISRRSQCLLICVVQFNMIFIPLIPLVEGMKLIPGSVKPCKIKKLSVRVTRVLFTMYGDVTEPPVVRIKVNYYDPQSKKAKELGTTPIQSNGRSLYPVWNETDGLIESADDVGLHSDLALEFLVFAESKLRLGGPLWRTVTLEKKPILGSNGLECEVEFHSLSFTFYGNIPILPPGSRETCTLNQATASGWPFANCVYGWIFFIPLYEKEDPTCDDSSRKT